MNGLIKREQNESIPSPECENGRMKSNSFALYRLPHQQVCTLVEQTSGEPQLLSSPTELSGACGYVVAPFAISPATPLLLIRPDKVMEVTEQTLGLDGANLEFPVSKPQVCRNETHSLVTANSDHHSSYLENFSYFHNSLKEGELQKVVLSRCKEIPRTSNEPPIRLFWEACRRYPRLFVALVFTPQSGLWLMATPEVLLQGDGCRWSTMALAGTMRMDDEQLQGEGEAARWSAKNIEEQRYVATYISQQLAAFSHDVSEEGPRTVRAAHLVHLRSDFHFTLLNNACIGEVLQALHPTPAVCGLPKEKAFRFILEHECTPRLYYSGFTGPLSLSTQPSTLPTSLYVSLRCMQITADSYRLYAGGGLLRDSVAEQEWLETEAKLETMRALLTAELMS